MMWFVLVALLSFLIRAPSCRSQAFHTVLVTNGFYIPPTTSALQGDVVTFIFQGKNHSVTQSTFNDPCKRALGGFDSDSWGVAKPGDPIPQWSLTITNDTETIWLYCKNTLPAFHCSNGMVGAINPPTGTNQNFSAFLSAAKAVQGIPSQTPGAILTGIGAVATGVPVLVANTSSATTSVPASSTSSTSSSSSDVPSVTPTPVAASSSGPSATVLGGAIGGALGGVIILGIIFAIWFFGIRDRHRYEEPTSTRMTFEPATAIPPRDFRSSASWAPPTPTPRAERESRTNDSFVTGSSGLQETSSAAPLNRLSSANVVQLASELATFMKAGPSNSVNPASLPAIHEKGEGR